MRLQEWGPESLPDLATLWAAASPAEPLGVDELRTVLIDGGGTILASEDGRGAVAFVQGSAEARERGNIRFLVIHPLVQRQGRGRALLLAAEDRLRRRGVNGLRLAGGVPRYLWPGIDERNLPARSLATSAGYEVAGTEVNMTMPTSFRADSPPGVVVRKVDPADVTLVREFVAVHWPIWLTEFDIAAGRGSVFAAWVDDRVIGFFAHSAMRSGWIGPMGTDQAFRSRGVGAAMLAAVCADIGRRGHPTAEVAWVGPVEYFADRGALVTRTFTRFVKRLG